MPHHSAYQLPFKALDIAIVDDSQHMRQILHTVIKSFGIRRLRMYDCGQKALSEMVNDPPNMLITDWQMKPLNGYELLTTIRKSEMMPLSLLPVIMLTGYASRQFVQSCFDAGVHQFLVKPLSPNTIYLRLKWILRDSRMLFEENGTYKFETQADKELREQNASIDYLKPQKTRPDVMYEPDVMMREVNDSWQL